MWITCATTYGPSTGAEGSDSLRRAAHAINGHWSADELEAAQVVLGPTRLPFQHGTQSFDFEGLTWTVEGDSDAAAVRMRVDAMSAVVAAEAKAIFYE